MFNKLLIMQCDHCGNTFYFPCREIDTKFLKDFRSCGYIYTRDKLTFCGKGCYKRYHDLL